MRIVETAVARDFHAHKRRFDESLILASQLHFCHQQPFVVAVKLIDFKRVLSRRNKIAVLVYHAATAQKQQMFGLIKGYLFLKLIA